MKIISLSYAYLYYSQQAIHVLEIRAAYKPTKKQHIICAAKEGKTKNHGRNINTLYCYPSLSY